MFEIIVIIGMGIIALIKVIRKAFVPLLGLAVAFILVGAIMHMMDIKVSLGVLAGFGCVLVPLTIALFKLTRWTLGLFFGTKTQAAATIILIVVVAIGIGQIWKTSDGPAESIITETPKPSCWVIVAYRESIKLYEGAGVNYPVMEPTYNEGTQALLLKEEDGWTKIRMPNGQEGWGLSSWFDNQCPH